MTAVGIFNPLDITVIIIYAICMAWCYHKGLLVSLFSLLSWIVALGLSNTVYPIVSKFLRNTSDLYNIIKNSVISSMELSVIAEDATRSLQNEWIEGLSLPSFIINPLLANNNPTAYVALGVETLEDYIGGFIANMIINAISMTLVFVIVLFLMKLLTHFMKLMSKLPIIRTFNKGGGLLAGAVQGTLIIWIGLVIVIIFFSTAMNPAFFTMLEQSHLAKWINGHNIIMQMLAKVFA